MSKHQQRRNASPAPGLESLEGRAMLSTTGMTPTTAGNDVFYLYETLLERNPAPSEVSYWSGLLEKGVKPEAVYNGFTAGSEYKGLVADGTINPAKVPTAANFQAGAAYANALPNVGSSGLGTKAAVTSYVDSLYFNLLGRSADASGETFWVTRIQNGTSLTSVVQGFLGSTEYANGIADGTSGYSLASSSTGSTTETTDFVDSLYGNILLRSPDTSGETYWANQIATGTAPNTVITIFLTSPEFIKSIGTGNIGA